MSIYATNYVINEEGTPVLIKHLNKIRVDRGSLCRVRGWNKTGVKARRKKINNQTYNKYHILFNRHENNTTMV